MVMKIAYPSVCTCLLFNKSNYMHFWEDFPVTD